MGSRWPSSCLDSDQTAAFVVLLAPQAQETPEATMVAMRSRPYVASRYFDLTVVFWELKPPSACQIVTAVIFAVLALGE